MPQYQPPGRRPQGGMLRILLLLFGLMIAFTFVGPMIAGLGGSGSPRAISYSEFRKDVADGQVTSVVTRGAEITGQMKATGQSAGGKPQEFVTRAPQFGDPQLLPLLLSHGVEITAKPPRSGVGLSLLFSWLPLLLVGGLLFMSYRQMRRQGGQISSFSQNRARRYQKGRESTRFSDVAGAEGAKQELEEIVDFLKNPSRYHRLGAKPPKGALLVGPPGTGKTLLARAVAGEAGVSFFSISGSDFMEMFVGVGASRVRSMFRDAQKSSPAIIFVDELDSIGRRRGAGVGGGHDEREQTLNQMLSELDGFEPNAGVVVLAATNRPDILDPALLRPGRFDRRIMVDRPTTKDRLAILRIHSRDKPIAADVDLERIAQMTPGFSGADLANLLNEAALLAARLGRNDISDSEVDNARDRVLLGLRRTSLVLSEEEKRRIAYHEGGHAVVAASLPATGDLQKVSIIPRDQSLGVTQQFPLQERYLYDKSSLVDRITVLLAGRAAETLVFPEASNGAENDLKEATQLARRMVLHWGMSSRLANTAFGNDHEDVFLGADIAHTRTYSEETAAVVDDEVRGLIDRCFAASREILERGRAGLDRVAERLLEREELPGAEIRGLLEAAVGVSG